MIRSATRFPRVFRLVGRNLTSVLVAAAVGTASLGGSLLIAGAATASTITFYVSPTGNDANPGTSLQPWRSFFFAAKTAQAGDTVVFADGTYHETGLPRFYNSGRSGERITFKATHKQQAHIHFVGNMNTNRIWINKPYITIMNFDFYGDDLSAAANSSDVLLAFRRGADHGQAIGNKIHHVYEDGLKAGDVTDFVADGNTIYDVVHEGLDSVNVANVMIRNNTVYDVGRTGLLAKGGARNVRFLNNYVGTPKAAGGAFVAYSLGGSTGSLSTYTVTGFEGYNLVAENNVAYSGVINRLSIGYSLRGCNTCGVFNNVVVGARYPLSLMDGGDPNGSYGQTAWTAHNRDIFIKNNILLDCNIKPVLDGDAVQGTLTLDYNLFYNCPLTITTQAHSIIDPRFVNKNSDWHLQAGSPAIGTGSALDTFPVYTDAKTPAIPVLDLKRDRNNTARVGSWDLGIYNVPDA